ncbi:hypothetical protein I79_012285 [Cricetulus griseus]|uniref:Uncharacterized protein n=1 Tax=Cricetulus griseus TaxID=10029 RepID=G3HNE7_CRIGR|nr:hypothetical protein I79_012285 [Cricetulus griseus]
MLQAVAFARVRLPSNACTVTKEPRTFATEMATCNGFKAGPSAPQVPSLEQIQVFLDCSTQHSGSFHHWAVPGESSSFN